MLAAAVARALARDPARRYEDAAEMEDALRDGLAGVGHTEDLDATRARCPATTLHAACCRRRGTGHAHPAPTDAAGRGRSRPPRRPAPSRRQPAPQREKSRRRQVGGAGARAGRRDRRGVFAYQAVNTGGNKQVPAHEDVGGSVDGAVQLSRTWSRTTPGSSRRVQAARQQPVLGEDARRRTRSSPAGLSRCRRRCGRSGAREGRARACPRSSWCRP